ncbi:MAG: HEAT repeat domain-containing protein, partial [Myxococcales bacterium]|nr:HEAT repeat domain-containing protein [Myxococcales bacterium]
FRVRWAAEARNSGAVRVEIELYGSTANRNEFEVLATSAHIEEREDGEPVELTAARAINETLDDVIENLVANAIPRLASDRELIDSLQLDAPTERLLPALREVYRRNLRAAEDQLIILLQTESPEVLLAAAYGLGRLDSEKAVADIIDVIHRDHLAMAEQLVPVLGNIGGEEAETYLGIVAEHHDNPAMRQLAQEALRNMELGH